MEGKWIRLGDRTPKDDSIKVYVVDGCVVKADSHDYYGKVYLWERDGAVYQTEELTVDEFIEQYNKGNIDIGKQFWH